MPYNLAIIDLILTKIVALFLRVIFFTCRKEFIISAETQEIIKTNNNCLVAFWHQSVLMLPFLYLHICKNINQEARIAVLISAHRDGRLIAKVASYFKIDSVAGSSSRNSITASRELLERLEQGSFIAITPDGPKGPAKKIKEGIIRLAEISNKPVIPVKVEVSKAFYFKSWDRMILPLPFSKITFRLLDPIAAENSLTLQEVL